MKPSNALYSILLLLLLSGCKANEDSLEDFVVQVEAKARKEVEQLVPASEFAAATYQRRAFRPPLNFLRKLLCRINLWLKKLLAAQYSCS